MIRVENMSIIEGEAGNNRRDFLKGMLGAGAFVLGISIMPEQLFAKSPSGSSGDPFPPLEKAPLQPSVYLAIGTDGTVYVIAHRSEMGNGVRTSLPRIVADELDADWASVKIVTRIRMGRIP
jgi:isoquinoline 1-oxidoreductase subunit beta